MLSEVVQNIISNISQEVDRLNSEVISEIVIHDKVVVIKEPFTAGLVAIRLYPFLWPNQDPLDLEPSMIKLRSAILKRLRDSQPSDGGGWPFFDKVSGGECGKPTMELIDPDADTTAVCWSALMLASEVGVDDCALAFNLICNNLAKDGDVYFDNSGRLDLIALCNMLFFFMLYCEMYEKEKGETIDISMNLKNGLLRARTILLHFLTLDADEKAAYWLRYYVGDTASAISRVSGFIAPMVLRWPDHEFIVPIKHALEQKVKYMARQVQKSPVDICMLAMCLESEASQSLLQSALRQIESIFIDREAIFFTVLHRMAFVSAIFNASCFLAAASNNRAAYRSLEKVSAMRDLASTCHVYGPRPIPSTLLMMSMSLPEIYAADHRESMDNMLYLACAGHKDILLNHFSQTFSPTVEHRSLPDALVVSEVFRAILAHGWSLEFGPRMKNARELLVHCLALSKAELEGFWTLSQLYFQLSILLTLKRFPNSTFLRPLETALRQGATTLPSILSVMDAKLSEINDVECVLNLEDPIVHAYIQHIAHSQDTGSTTIPDEALEHARFAPHLNYENLKLLIKQQSKQSVDRDKGRHESIHSASVIAA